MDPVVYSQSSWAARPCSLVEIYEDESNRFPLNVGKFL